MKAADCRGFTSRPPPIPPHDGARKERKPPLHTRLIGEQKRRQVIDLAALFGCEEAEWSIPHPERAAVFASLSRIKSSWRLQVAHRSPRPPRPLQLPRYQIHFPAELLLRLQKDLLCSSTGMRAFAEESGWLDLLHEFALCNSEQLLRAQLAAPKLSRLRRSPKRFSIPSTSQPCREPPLSSRSIALSRVVRGRVGIAVDCKVAAPRFRP
jgi:hypothetical protein